MQAAISVDRLRRLFEAFRERNDSAFLRTAEAIIVDELAANHHGSATELKRALGPAENGRAENLRLSVLPKDRRSGEDLIFFENGPPRVDQLLLTDPTRKKYDRIMEEHRRRQHLLKHGYRPKSKLLFWGPPGCGKTLASRTLGNELGLPVGTLRLSSVISSFVGDTAAHVQRVFNRAASLRMVLLLDEFDALGKDRDDPNDVGELKRVVNSVLQAIDTFMSSDSIIIAASNHQYLLDPALWRRFDDAVEFPLPDAKTREKFLRKILTGVSVTGSLKKCALTSAAMSFSEIERAVVNAIKTMLLEDRSTLTATDLHREILQWKIDIESSRKRGSRRRK
jgi:SpoVK/Ycf46/Vps4 family AAA+-type ATPase